MSDEAGRNELTELWEQVAHIARARVALIAATVDALHQRAPVAPAQRVAAAQECHKLIGSLDSYGRHGGSRLAEQAAALLEHPEPDLDELADVVDRLRTIVGGGPGER